MTAAPSSRHFVASPYVGPRPFRRGELFFGREREASELVNTLIANRIVLLHSPSGAGKTSLLQAAVAPVMERRGFQLCTQHDPLSAAKVSTPATVKADNRYVASVATCLLAHVPDLDAAHSFTVSEALDLLAGEPNTPEQQLLVIDQFEEILSLDPTDFDGQKGFFRQLGEALDCRNRWALIAIREDFMGGLDPFLRYIPGHLRSTFRLDRLGPVAAKRAVKLPAKEFGVDFTDDAATLLIKDLQRIRTGTADGAGNRTATYVEPVFLEVVCDSLWRRVHEQPSGVTSITDDDVKAFGPLDAALAVYYNAVLQEASGGRRDVEREIREWIELQLLTKDGLRRQTRAQPAVPEPDIALGVLQTRYLVRGEPRPEAIWWELSHDRMSGPITADNEAWRARYLESWRRTAYEWHRSHYDQRYLAKGETLRAARSHRRRNNRLTNIEREYIDRSESEVTHEGALAHAKGRINFLLVVLVVSLALNVALAMYILSN